MFLPVYKALVRKYWFDEVYYNVFARGGRKLGHAFWKGGDSAVLDGVMVDGSASVVARSARVFRRMQTGFLYHYAFTMIVGLILLLGGLWYWGLR
jgi:NADH-quinone oxidoreductase subunit L